MLVITGPLRSGTSPLARMAHQMGILMGESMGMPRPGSDELEYEDYALSFALARHIAGVRPIGDTRKFFVDYVSERIDHFQRMRGLFGRSIVRGWGVKTPYLLPFYRQWREVLGNFDEKVRVVLCDREPIETYNSLKRSQPPKGSLEPVYKMQDELYESLPLWSENADVVVSLRDTRSNPGGVARQMARTMGLDLEDEQRAVAVRGIRRKG